MCSVAATKNLDPGTPHSRTPYLWQPYPWKPCIPGDHCAQKLALKNLDLAHHILETLNQDTRIHGHRILGNHENVEILMLRKLHPRIYIVANNILECLNQGNHILGNRILGIHIPGNHCAQFPATKNLDLAHHILERHVSANRILENHVSLETIVLRTRVGRV